MCICTTTLSMCRLNFFLVWDSVKNGIKIFNRKIIKILGNSVTFINVVTSFLHA